MTRWLTFVFALALIFVSPGCRKPQPVSGEPEFPIAIKDDSQGLLLTWIDEKGDFHVETGVKDIPFVGRDVVRVVDSSKDEGTHEGKIFVADLRQAKPDGTYPIKTMTRGEFDQVAVDRRAKHGPTLVDNGTPDAGTGVIAAPGTTTQQTGPSANLQAVIIYGASWCGPCHDAAAYLRKKGIPFVEKDVDEDHSAASEMRTKLKHAGLPGGSIPVIDVRGKILVGFSPRAIDEALGRAT
jgi:glutaredoxin